MSLILTIEDDMKDSLRKKQVERTSTLRMLKNALKNKAIAEKVSEEKLSDDVVIAIVRQEIKKRKESIEAFTKGDRAELAEKEKRELEMLEAYAPAMMSIEDVKKAIEEVVSEASLTEPYKFGQLMGLVMKKTAGRADGNDVKKQVQQFVSST